MDDILLHLDDCLTRQLDSWPEVKKRFEDLQLIQTKVISSSGLKLQFNPARIVSTAANISKANISQRPCFLCAENRPKQQMTFDLGDSFDLLVNPFPILKNHFTVVSRTHQPQCISSCYTKLIQIASSLQPGYIVFYNGPRSGASAPDHLHLQIGLADGVPLIDKLIENNPPADKETITVEPFGYPVNIYIGTSPERLKQILDDMTILDGEYETRLNIISFNRNGMVMTAIIPRGKHRPDCYYKEDNDKILVSPGAIDMCGLIITPRQTDFESLSEQQISSIYREVTPHQPHIKVGIMASTEIRFNLKSEFSDGESTFSGEQSVSIKEGLIFWKGQKLGRLTLNAVDGQGIFTLHNVTIGIGFHWQRNEEQTFSGSLVFIPDSDRIWAINELPTEDYLKSVVSSEMKSTAPIEFLKAHAIISRSWVLAQCKKTMKQSASENMTCDQERIIKWYDHDQHTLFDVCADDHCQRYQGITRIINQNADLAVKDTFGQILVSEGYLCDTRFSKCCGGITEQFETCWQDTHLPYLVPVRDSLATATPLPDLTNEEDAEKWIMTHPNSFCSSVNSSILSRILNGYDLETSNYYRWQIHYTTAQITDLFKKKSGLDIGDIIDLKPIRRGPSGRIYELDIISTDSHIIIGKELEIRRVLSETHLFSSAFVIEHDSDGFTLHGAGWGHGAGLCQIGAAVMGENGYDYKEILSHYYPNTQIGRFY